jgi:hypothetical protein
MLDAKLFEKKIMLFNQSDLPETDKHGKRENACSDSRPNTRSTEANKDSSPERNTNITSWNDTHSDSSTEMSHTTFILVDFDLVDASTGPPSGSRTIKVKKENKSD